MFSTGYYKIDRNDGRAWEEEYGFLEVGAELGEEGEAHRPLAFYAEESDRWPLPSLSQGEEYRFTRVRDMSAWPGQKGSGEMYNVSWIPIPEDDCEGYESSKKQFGPGPVDIVIDDETVVVGFVEHKKAGYVGRYGLIGSINEFPLVLGLGESARAVRGTALNAEHVACVSDAVFDGRANWEPVGTLETYSIP